MTAAQAKAELRQVIQIQRHIQTLEAIRTRDVARLERLITRDGDQTGQLRDALDKVRHEIGQYTAAMHRQRSGILARIEAIEESTLREVLALRYLEGASWRSISRRMYISERTAQYLHGRALREYAGRSK